MLLCNVVQAQELSSVALWPAWDGTTRPGATTELGLELASARDREVEVEIVGGAMSIELTMLLRASVAQTLWLPFVVGRDPRLSVRITESGDVLERLDRRLTLAPAGVAVIVTVTSVDVPAPVADLKGHWASASAGSLPRDRRGYAAISTLVIDAPMLARLDARQQRALEAFMADCGRLVTFGLSEQMAGAFRRRAGCGARRLAVATSIDDLPRALSSISDQRPAPLPDDELLESLLPGPEAVTTGFAVALYLLAYLVAVIALGYARQRVFPVLVLPLAAVLLALAAWHRGAPHARLAVWSEIAPGLGTSRFSALLSVEGTGRGRLRLPVPQGSSVWRAGELETHRLHVDGSSPDVPWIELETRLLSRRQLRLRGTAPMLSPLEWSHSEGGYRVRANEELEDEAILVSDEGHWRIPPMARGQIWRSSEHPVSRSSWTGSPPARALADRLPVLLAPRIPLKLNAIPATEARGWLVIERSTDGGGWS